MRKADPVSIMIEVIDLRIEPPDTRYHIYRKPCDREHFLVESCDGRQKAEERATWLAERDVDEFHVYDPREHRIVFKAQQEWPGLRESQELAVSSQRI
jgi:hypothetical protein